MKNYFLNLTNGIEYLPKLDEPHHFTRIRSTTIERKDYLFLLMDLDHNFLLHLAMGKECVFVDYGTNRKNSKTIYTAIPLILYILNRRWLGKEIEPYRYTRGSDKKIYDRKQYYEHIYNELFLWNQTKDKNKMKTKIDYFKKFLNTNEIKCEVIGNSTHNDGNYSFYRDILLNL